MKVDISLKEVQALDELYKDAKCPIAMGMILGIFRVRIQEAINKERETQLKEKFSKKK
jgi:hypothetical protein